MRSTPLSKTDSTVFPELIVVHFVALSVCSCLEQIKYPHGNNVKKTWGSGNYVSGKVLFKPYSDKWIKLSDWTVTIFNQSTIKLNSRFRRLLAKLMLRSGRATFLYIATVWLIWCRSPLLRGLERNKILPKNRESFVSLLDLCLRGALRANPRAICIRFQCCAIYMCVCVWY